MYTCWIVYTYRHALHVWQGHGPSANVVEERSIIHVFLCESEHVDGDSFLQATLTMAVMHVILT